jgi:hypothetical protein
MRSKYLYLISLLLFCLLGACSSDQSDEDQGEIGNDFTQEIAKQGVAAVQGPLKKAQEAAQSLEEHSLEIDALQKATEK